jgi:hypothetical protein
VERFALFNNSSYECAFVLNIALNVRIEYALELFLVYVCLMPYKSARLYDNRLMVEGLRFYRGPAWLLWGLGF